MMKEKTLKQFREREPILQQFLELSALNINLMEEKIRLLEHNIDQLEQCLEMSKGLTTHHQSMEEFQKLQALKQIENVTFN